jgi:hypothetical protein
MLVNPIRLAVSLDLLRELNRARSVLAFDAADLLAEELQVHDEQGGYVHELTKRREERTPERLRSRRKRSTGGTVSPRASGKPKGQR